MWEPDSAYLEPDAELPNVLDAPGTGPRAIRGAALRAGSYFTTALLAALSAPLLTRHLGQIRFGEYYAVGSLVALVSGLTEGGLGSIGMREYAVLTGERRRRFMSNLLGMRLAFVGVGLLGGLAFAAAAYSSVLVAGTAIASLGVLIGVAQVTLAVPLFTELVLGRRVFYELLSQVVSVALVVLGVVIGAGLLPFLFIPIPAGLLLLLLTARKVGRGAPRRPSFDFARWRTIVHETYPVAASTAAQTLYMRSVILVMTLVASPAVWGVYAYSVRVLEILLGIPLLLVSAVFPLMVRAVQADRRRLAYVMERTLQVGIVVGLGMTLCTIVVAGPIMAILTGTHGGQAATVLRLQSPDLLLAFFSAAWGAQLIALRHHRALLVSSAVAVLLTAGLAALLVPDHGALGGGVASVAGESGLVVTMGISLWRSGDLFVSRGRVPRAVLCAAVAMTVATVAPVPSLDRLAILVLLYGGGLAISGAIPEEIREAALGRLREMRG